MDLTPKAILEQVNKLTRHVILCGAGRTGITTLKWFTSIGVPIVVIEQDQEIIEILEERANRPDSTLLYVVGDATEDETLEKAGLRRARGLITALSDDKDNLFVTLTARALNPDVKIVARVDNERQNKEKLARAGADKVISTEAIGGMRMASEIIRPEVVKFLDQMMTVTARDKTLRFTELPIADITTPELVDLVQAHHHHEEMNGLHIRDIGRHTGLLVVAIKTPLKESVKHGVGDDIFHIKKRYRFTPRGDDELHLDDVLVVIGTQNKLDAVTGNVTDSQESDSSTTPGKGKKL